jgi:hypothetical protein
VRKALAIGDRLPSERDVIARAERWRPWRAYAVLALWTGEAPANGRIAPAATRSPKPTRRAASRPRVTRGAARTNRSTR